MSSPISSQKASSPAGTNGAATKTSGLPVGFNVSSSSWFRPARLRLRRGARARTIHSPPLRPGGRAYRPGTHPTCVRNRLPRGSRRTSCGSLSNRPGRPHRLGPSNEEHCPRIAFLEFPAHPGRQHSYRRTLTIVRSPSLGCGAKVQNVNRIRQFGAPERPTDIYVRHSPAKASIVPQRETAFASSSFLFSPSCSSWLLASSWMSLLTYR